MPDQQKVIDDVRIEDGFSPATGPDRPDIPRHPAYQQILTEPEPGLFTRPDA